MLLNGILSIPVSISYTETMSSGFYQYTSFIVTGSIWNTCYLEYSHTLLVSASFTGITHYLYTIGFLVHLESINSHSTIEYVPEYVLQCVTFGSLRFEHLVAFLLTRLISFSAYVNRG